MIDGLSLILVCVALLGTLGAAALAVLNKLINWPLLVVLMVLELGLLVQLVVGIVELAGTDRDVSGVVFVTYLVAALLVPPIGLVWAVAEKSRWGSGVLAVAGLVVVVLELRLEQVWFGA
jgi:hypothetical protein